MHGDARERNGLSLRGGGQAEAVVKGGVPHIGTILILLCRPPIPIKFGFRMAALTRARCRYWTRPAAGFGTRRAKAPRKGMDFSGADRSESATASASPLTQDGSGGNGQGRGLRSAPSGVLQHLAGSSVTNCTDARSDFHFKCRHSTECILAIARAFPPGFFVHGE
jgi:hypothetical protein